MKIGYVLFLLIVATVLEASGDAFVRLAIYKHTGFLRISFFAAGAALLLGYGTFLNLAPVEFSRIVGLYIAVLFIVWQVVNCVVFKTTPEVPVVIGGCLIVVGGTLVTFWRAS